MARCCCFVGDTGTELAVVAAASGLTKVVDVIGGLDADEAEAAPCCAENPAEMVCGRMSVENPGCVESC